MIPVRIKGCRAEQLISAASACLLTVLSAACAPDALAKEPPAAVLAMVEREWPGYDWRGSDRHVGFGDFDADGTEDVAMLLEGADDWQLVVFRQQEGEHYRAETLDRFPGDDRAFKDRYPSDQLTLEAVTPDAASDAAALALRLPAAEQTALQFAWDSDHELFGATRLHLAAAEAVTSCAYDPQSGEPNPLGMRAFVTVEEEGGNTSVVYEQFPETLDGTAPVTLASRRELVFHQTPIGQARALLREQPGYYRELTGDDDPAGFATIDASLTCR